MKTLRDNASLVTTTPDKLKFVIPCRRTLPLIIVIVNVANKKMRQALKKRRRRKFSHFLLSLSFFSFFSILKRFSLDLFSCFPHSKMLNYLFRRKLFLAN